jgi:hypothetical protein
MWARVYVGASVSLVPAGAGYFQTDTAPVGTHGRDARAYIALALDMSLSES